MIAPPAGVRVLMATKPVDFRKGSNGLAALIKDEMKTGSPAVWAAFLGGC